MTVGHGAFGKNRYRPVVLQSFSQRINLLGHAHPVFALDEHGAIEPA